MNTQVDPKLLIVDGSLTRGPYKDIYIGNYDDNEVAVSAMRRSLSDLKDSDLKLKLWDHELQMVALLSHHPRLPRFYGYCEASVTFDGEPRLVLVNEYCSEGDLTQFIEDGRIFQLSLNEIVHLSIDIALAVDMLHSCGLIHGKE